MSGALGTVFRPIVDGARLWVKAVNQRGGINGHPLEIIVSDDGADPARRQALIREAVEKRKVVAFLAEGAPITGATTLDYLKEKRVPVIGTSGIEDFVYSSPMYFPQATSGLALSRTLIYGAAQQLIPEKKTKIATLVCAEVAQCDQIEDQLAQASKTSGLDVVYQGKATLTQPDYTAECLNASRAGAQALAIFLDSNSMVRLQTSCARQGYRPVLMTLSGNIADKWKEDPGFDGFVGISPFYPYFLTGRLLQEYQSARAQYGAGLPEGIGPLTGWAAGKLLEAAAKNLGDPTSAGILDGLWSLKDETLGSLTLPLTFTRDKPPAVKECWYNIVIRNRAWASPDEGQLHCKS